MSATCPHCGVAVVPGYVKCPKCHALLPRVTFKKGQSAEGAGGTSLEQSSTGGVPVVPIVIAVVVAVGIIAYFGLRKTGGQATNAALDAGVVAPAQQPAQPAQPVRGPDVSSPATPDTPTQPDTPAGPRPDEVARQLQRDLQRQQVFATVTVVPGSALEVRSGSCGDKAMKPTVEGFAATAHAAGLTRIRCVEQSGGVVFTRDL